jgi:aldose 1-epimerase
MTTLDVENFGTMPDGRIVKIYTLTNANGLKARVTEYGAILVSIETPDRAGTMADLTHGYDLLEEWLVNPCYLGASVGRYGNRIKNGSFTLEGSTYQLAVNNSPNGHPCALHGGLVGFDKVLWAGSVTAENSVELSYTSPAGEEGYPGTLTVKITYRLTEDNELIWLAEASTDATTVLNLIHHSYWNLSGDPTAAITDHLLSIDSDAYLPKDAGLIPTGEITPLQGTPMDFRTPTQIGSKIDENYESLQQDGGYDHAWVLKNGGDVALAARVEDPKTGRIMELFTNQPAMHLYTGNGFDGSVVGKKGVAYQPRTAFCLETEAFPDAPNQPAFPSAVLKVGETYRHMMIHRFSVAD